MSMISPAIATKNPAPADSLISFIVISNPVGLPNNFGLSDSDFCVFETHTGSLSYPYSSYFFILLSALGINLTPSAPYISFAIISIFSFIGSSSSYNGENFSSDFSFSSTAEITLSTSSFPPSPPFSQISHKATSTPFALQNFSISFISASVSVINLFIATTTGI